VHAHNVIPVKPQTLMAIVFALNQACILKQTQDHVQEPASSDVNNALLVMPVWLAIQERLSSQMEIVNVTMMVFITKMTLVVVQDNVTNIAIIAMIQPHVFHVQPTELFKMEFVNVNHLEF